jgi:hypothetical protein
VSQDRRNPSRRTNRVLPRPVRREAYASILRITGVTLAYSLTYAYAPMSDPVHDGIPLLLSGLIVLAGLVVWHVRATNQARYPAVRAIEALATSVPFLLLTFSAAYYMMQKSSPGAFAVALTRLDALYFSVTVFATVGFGDITAHSELARAVVTVQMIVDFIFVGTVVRVLIGVAQIRKSANTATSADSPSAD